MVKRWLLVGLIVLAGCGRVSIQPQEESRSTESDVRNVSRVQDRVGWALTDAGVLRTSDGGESWSAGGPRGIARIRDSFFLDANQGWVAAGPAQNDEATTLAVYRTADAGRSWAKGSSIKSAGDVESLSFTSNKIGLMGVRLPSGSNFRAGEAFVSRNSGSSWSRVALPVGGRLGLDGESVWLAGGPSAEELYFSGDLGKTFERRALPRVSGLESGIAGFDIPRFSGANGVLVSTVSGSRSGVGVYQSTDSGRSWKATGSYPLDRELDQGVLVAVDVTPDGTLVIALNDGSRILKSRNGGAGWDEISPNGLSGGLTEIDFIDSSKGWAVALNSSCAEFKSNCRSKGDVFSTTDGGQTWKKLRL